MINQELSEIFQNMSSYPEMQDDQKSFFKARAFKKASEIISKLPYDFSDPNWHNDIKRMKDLEGIGQSIAEHIHEYAVTGKILDYEKMKKDSPVKLEELINIQGIGPKTVKKLYKELGVTDIASLKKCAEEGKISKLEGFKEKSEQNILESIKFAIVNKDRKSIAEVEVIVNELLDYLTNDKNITKIEVGGSFRRRRETIGDIDILACSNNPKTTMDFFVHYQNVEKIIGLGDTKSSIWLKSKIQVDIRIVPEDCFGSALQYFTGNKDHNVKLRNIAIKKNYKLSEYGLFERLSNDNEGKKIAGSHEEDVYSKLGLKYIEPELRENTGEIEAGVLGNLPTLITLNDIRGDLQMHTTHSDGVNTIEEMANKGIQLDYKYIGITDHFGKLKIANAIDSTEFKSYLNDIRETQKKVNKIKIYAGGEIEIDKDGNLEFDNSLLQELDYVIASVHFSTKMSKEMMTRRIIKALQNPLTKILAHPTGRIIGQRPGFEFDYKEVFSVAKNEGVALEINAHPLRLDLSDELTKLATGMNCKIIINTDAHSVTEMENMRFGIDVARRGWAEKRNLVYDDFIIS